MNNIKVITGLLGIIIPFIFSSIFISSCQRGKAGNGEDSKFSISILPSSVRLDPVKNEIINDRFKAVTSSRIAKDNLLEKNWIYDGDQVSLHGARGEYILFRW